MAEEREDVEAEIAELTRQLDESPRAQQEDAIAAELQRLTERQRTLLRSARRKGVTSPPER